MEDGTAVCARAARAWPVLDMWIGHGRRRGTSTAAVVEAAGPGR